MIIVWASVQTCSRARNSRPIKVVRSILGIATYVFVFKITRYGGLQTATEKTASNAFSILEWHFRLANGNALITKPFV